MAFVSVDTMVLIWGLRGGGSSHQAEMEHRARVLFNLISENNDSLIVPTVVISELLVPVPVEEHGKLIVEVLKRAIPAPFDLQAASKAAELWAIHDKLPKKEKQARRILKSDVQIVASAAIAGATVFYSNDRKCRRLAKLANMDARDLPTHDENLFRDKEARKQTGKKK